MHWATTLAAVGALLGGLGLPIAFLQLGAQHGNELRAQVNQVGMWAGQPSQDSHEPDPVNWAIQLFIRNGSELPVLAHAADLSVRPWGYDLRAADGHSARSVAKKLGKRELISFTPGTIAPGATWTVFRGYCTVPVYDRPQPPMVSAARLVLTDAAGRQWEIRPSKAGAPVVSSGGSASDGNAKAVYSRLPGQWLDALHMTFTYHQLGTTAQQRGQLDEAEDWYRKSLAIEEDLSDRYSMAIIYHQLGIAAQDRGRLDEAGNRYSRSLTIKEQFGDRRGMALSYAQLGLLAEDLAQPRQALAWNIRSVTLFGEFPHPGTGSAPRALARLTRRLGMPALEE